MIGAREVGMAIYNPHTDATPNIIPAGAQRKYARHSGLPDRQTGLRGTGMNLID